jgi:hypothetical protein
MIRNFLLITIRNLMKNRLFIFINVFGMGIVISVFLLFFISGLTIGYKVIGAASMNPVSTLRVE